MYEHYIFTENNKKKEASYELSPKLKKKKAAAIIFGDRAQKKKKKMPVKLFSGQWPESYEKIFIFDKMAEFKKKLLVFLE